MIIFGIVALIIVLGATLLLLSTRKSRVQREQVTPMESSEQRQRSEQVRKAMEHEPDYPNRNLPGPWR